MILLSLIFHIQCSCRCKESLICSSCSNRTCIHQCDGRDLSALQLTSLSVREVSRCMTDRKCVVRRCISCSETWTTECSFYNSSCFHQISDRTIFHQFHINRSTCRINAECKFVCSDILSFNDVCCRTDIFKSATGTACNDTLFHIELAIFNLILQ